MGVSDLKTDTNAGSILDLSAQGIQKLDPSFVCSDDTQTLILDRNHIMKLDHLERSPGLQQLSVANNRLVRMMAVSRLTELRVLNLPNNSIGYIEGLRDLPHLEWLNLAGNNIKVIENLGNCVALQHLDLSDNNISNIGDLTKLLALKTLLLHGNSVSTLRTVPTNLPVHLSILSLAENEIQDLNEVSYLAPLHELEQLSIMSNPCVMVTLSLPGFDYRPYIMSWCLNLKILDGYVVSQKEGLKAEWLYSQGKGRSYRPGHHVQLVQYLATVCPLISTPALETAEDAKLEKILTKQRFHQRQLYQQTHNMGCPSPPRPTRLDVEAHISPPHTAPPQGGARETSKAIAPSPPTATPSSRETGSTSVLLGIPSSEPTVQVNTWVGTGSSHPSGPVLHSPRVPEEHLHMEDVQTDEDRVNASLLSESTFLPISSSNPDPQQQPNHSDSEDETETFEPDSLAPECPNWRKKKPVMEKTHPPPSREDRENARRSEDKSTGSHQSCASSGATAGQQQGDRGDQPQNNLFQEISSETKVGPRHEETVVDATKSCSFGSDRAAVRIQSWWRGLHTRHHHPVAREVRSEIRLRRMQDHILFLSEEFERMQKLYEEERLQRLVQEEAVKFLWKQVQSMQKWQQSVEQQLASIPQAVTPTAQNQNSASGLCQPVVLHLPLPVACSTADPACPTDISFPDSGFQSTGEQPAGREDSFLSSAGTGDSLETVRALNLVAPNSTSGMAQTSPDCSLLEQYLNSVQQREEESEEVLSSDRTETPQPPSSPFFSPNKMAPQSASPLDKQSELQCKQDTPPSPVVTV